MICDICKKERDSIMSIYEWLDVYTNPNEVPQDYLILDEDEKIKENDDGREYCELCFKRLIRKFKEIKT